VTAWALYLALAVASCGGPDKAALDRIHVVRTTLTAGAAAAGPFVRSQRPEVRFEAQLEQAPQGASLELRCDWTGHKKSFGKGH